MKTGIYLYRPIINIYTYIDTYTCVTPKCHVTREPLVRGVSHPLAAVHREPLCNVDSRRSLVASVPALFECALVIGDGLFTHVSFGDLPPRRLDVVVAYHGPVAYTAHQVEALERKGTRAAKERGRVGHEASVLGDGATPVAEAARTREVLARKVLTVEGDAAREAVVGLEVLEQPCGGFVGFIGGAAKQPCGGFVGVIGGETQQP